MSQSGKEKRELRPFERMAKYLHQEKDAHPLLKDLPGRVLVHAHEEAVWLKWMQGNEEINFEIERPRWYEPLTKSHRRMLLDELARGLRENGRAVMCGSVTLAILLLSAACAATRVGERDGLGMRESGRHG